MFDRRPQRAARYRAAKLTAIGILCWPWHLQPALAGYDDGARYAFMASSSEAAVYVIDLHERKQTHSLKVATPPDSVAASEALKALIIGHATEQMLTLVDLTADQPGQYEYPLTIQPQTVQVSPIGETVAILDHDRKTLQVHALRRKEILLTTDGVNTDTELTFNPDGSTVYWVDQSGGTLHSIDLWSERKALRLAKEGAALSAMSRSVDGTLGFVSNGDTGIVFVVDLRDFRVVRSSRAGRAPGRPWGTADGQYMLVPNAGDGTITAISTLSSDAIYTVEAVENPVSINPGWIDTVAAVVGGDGKVAFFSIADGKALDQYQLGASPEAGIVTSDSKTLAIPVPGAGSLVFFDMRKRRKLSEIDALPKDIGPAALAISNNLCH